MQICQQGFVGLLVLMVGSLSFAQLSPVDHIHCEEDHDQDVVEVTWTNTGVYDDIQITFQGAGVTTTVPGDAQSATLDLPVFPVPVPIRVQPRINGVPGQARECYAVPDVDADVTFIAAPALGHPLQTVSTTVSIENEAPELNSFQFALCHDDSLLVPIEVERTPFMNTVNDGGLPDWQAIHLDTEPCLGTFPRGVSIATVVSIWNTHQLPVGDHDMFTITYSVLADQPTTTTLWFCETDCPPVMNRYQPVSGALLVPANTVCGAIEIAPVTFVRGDVDGADGVSVGDAVRILQELFGLVVAPGCPAAGDVNRSGARDLADPVYLLTYLFFNGPEPVAPFPECGEDPVGPLLECPIAPGCP